MLAASVVCCLLEKGLGEPPLSAHPLTSGRWETGAVVWGCLHRGHIQALEVTSSHMGQQEELKEGTPVLLMGSGRTWGWSIPPMETPYGFAMMESSSSQTKDTSKKCTRKGVHPGHGWWSPGDNLTFFKPRGLLRYRDYSTPVKG